MDNMRSSGDFMVNLLKKIPLDKQQPLVDKLKDIDCSNCKFENGDLLYEFKDGSRCKISRTSVPSIVIHGTKDGTFMGTHAMTFADFMSTVATECRKQKETPKYEDQK